MPRFSPRQLIVVALLAALILGLTLYRTFRPLWQVAAKRRHRSRL